MNSFITLDEFLSNNNENGSHIIICNRKSVGNALLRQYNRWDNKSVWNTKTMSIAEITKELILAYSIDQGNSDVPKFITNSGTDYSIMNILNNGAYATFPKGTISIATAQEIRAVLNEIRLNDIKNTTIDNEQKQKDLLDILDRLNEILDKENKLDKALAIEKSLEIMHKINSDTLHYLLPWTTNLTISTLETDIYSKKEEDFIRTFNNLASDNKNEVYIIEFLPKEFLKCETTFSKSYGIANEIRFVGLQIFDLEKNCMKLPYSDVAIYYPSPEYLSHIEGTLDSMHIPYSTSAKVYAKRFNLLRFMLAIVESLQNDYSYELLENVVKNPLFTFCNVTTQYIGALRNYRYVLRKGIGWGRDRYKNYINEIALKKDSEEMSEEERKALKESRIFAQMLNDYINIVENDKKKKNYSLSELLENLWNFTCKYTYPSNMEKTVLKETILDKINDLSLADNSLFDDLQSKLSFLHDSLDNIKVDTLLDSNGVLVESLNHFTIMERKYNFIVGLSATSFVADTKESPILLDDEKMKLLSCDENDYSCIDLSFNRNKLLKETLYNTLKSISLQKKNAPSIYYSYSYYDTQNLRDSAPSIAYLELKSDSKEQLIPNYDKWHSYINNDIIISTDTLSSAIKQKAQFVKEENNKYIEEQKKKAKKKQLTSNEVSDNVSDEESYDEGERVFEDIISDKTVDSKSQSNYQYNKLSSTSLQELLGCPLQYYYHHFKHLSADEQLKLTAHQWLIPTKRGNLCHYFMEKYMKRAMPPYAELSENIDQKAFEQCYEESIDKILAEIPYPSKNIYKREKDYYRKLSMEYIEYVHNKWCKDSQSGKNWEVIECERPFEITSTLDGDELIYNGYIDRIDGYVDNQGVLQIRIIDYKTGKKENKEIEVKCELQIQHVLYAIATEEFFRSKNGHDRLLEQFNDKLSDLDLKDFSGMHFEWVGYTFPYEEPSNRLLDVTSGIYNADNNVGFSDNVINRVKNTLIKMLHDNWEGLNEEFNNIIVSNINTYNGIMINYDKDKVIEDQKKFCEKNYCVYQDVCRRRLNNTLTKEEENND